MTDVLSWIGVMLGYLLIFVFGIVVGVMAARNFNAQDRAYWMAEGARAAFKKSKEVLHESLDKAKARTPVAMDEFGPLYKSDLDADALRDGRLERRKP